MSKIRDAMRKSEEEEVWRPEPHGAQAPTDWRGGDGALGLVPALSPEAIAYYEAVGKQIEVALGDVATRVLSFTGAVGGDGISTVVSQYGEMLARRGDRVLLIDGNPRHPSLHHQFQTPDVPGIAEYVSGTAPREAIVHPTGFRNLDLVPLGRCADRSEAERVSEALGEFQITFAESYEHVLVDSDYVGSPFSSSSSIARSDGVVVVVRAGKTNRQVAGRALDTTRQMGGKVLGVVLNRREFPIPEFIYRHL